MDNTKEYIRHLSLCSGYEGIGIGLRKVLPDVREIAHVEIEAFAISNLVAKMEASQIHPAPIFTNLKEFPFRKFRGCVDILSGGFPCQPFSAAGKRDGVEDPRHLFPYILEGIRECKPTAIFLENVEGIISSKTTDRRSVLKHVLESLEEVGYSATAGIFSASEVGAPHQRKRVFIMAYRKDFRCRGWEDKNRDDREGIQKQEGEERSVVRGKAEGCSGDARGDMANTNIQRLEGWIERATFQDGPMQADVGAEDGLSEPRELADTDSSRGGKDWKQPELWSASTKQSSTSTRLRENKREAYQEWQGDRWPSRPYEQQYEWEAPRTVTKPSVGGATDGATSELDPTANRMDRLRLLGNGVCPDVAAKAFIELTCRLV